MWIKLGTELLDLDLVSISVSVFVSTFATYCAVRHKGPMIRALATTLNQSHLGRLKNIPEQILERLVATCQALDWSDLINVNGSIAAPNKTRHLQEAAGREVIWPAKMSSKHKVSSCGQWSVVKQRLQKKTVGAGLLGAEIIIQYSFN